MTGLRLGRCNGQKMCQHYKSSLSVRGNFCQIAEQSVVLAFVISKDSIIMYKIQLCTL